VDGPVAEPMRNGLSGLARITAVAGAALVFLVLVFRWALCQPNYGDLPFPGRARADSAALERHVRFLAVTDPPRDWQSPAGLSRAAAYILSTFERSGAACSEQAYRARGLEMKNLIARFGPTSGRLVVVGAHYDVFGKLPGADDNASGVAGLLELARLLDGVRLSGPLELVAYSTEEPPFFGGAEMGSAVHAAGLARAGTPVRAMVCLEMIGYFSATQPDRALLLRFLYPSRGDLIGLIGRFGDRGLVRLGKRCFRGAKAVRAISYSGPTVFGSDLSDQRNYWAAGFPAIMVCDTAYLRNPNYHEAGDTADTLDYRRMAGVVDGVLSLIVHLAND
jgi:hypothetical protein